MSLKTCSLALLFAGILFLPSRGALLISEVVFNEVGSTADGEWIEIFNDTPNVIDLSNYKIGDEEASGGTSTTEALFQFPAGASIAPGEVQIVSGGATRFFTVYGFNPTYETAATDAGVPDMTVYAAWDPDGGILNMSNSNDQAVLVDGTDTVVDATSWGNNFAFNPSVDITGNIDGQSIFRPNPYADTNTASDWTLGPTTSPAATRSTPGTVPPVPEPSTIILAIGCIAAACGIRRRK
jgi:glycerophosphoryl diester phosphodiesterase